MSNLSLNSGNNVQWVTTYPSTDNLNRTPVRERLERQKQQATYELNTAQAKLDKVEKAIAALDANAEVDNLLAVLSETGVL
jgi:hypothetical protein